MLGGIKSTLLLVHRDAKLAKELEDKEEGTHVDKAPAKNHEDANDLASKEHASALVEETPVGCTAIGLVDIVHLGKEAAEEEASSSTSHVHWGSRQWVVNLELDEEAADNLKPAASPESTDEGGPRLNNLSAASDGNKSNEGTVAAVNHAPGLLEEEAKDELGEGSSSTGEGGGDSSTTSNLASTDIVNYKG